MSKRQTRRRKLMNLNQQRELIARIVEIREHGQRLRSEHDKLMDSLNQTVAVGDVLEVTMSDGSRRRVSIQDPFLGCHGRTVSVSRTITVDRFHLLIEELPTCQNDTDLVEV
ncbi:hypothetical protein [Planctomicrobium sp. SH527]|uniref:hypothetical protein n=1 Tax=Planctomicrobium sp. SH527 TaxID=3448123 RepID=UPI003F5C24E7